MKVLNFVPEERLGGMSLRVVRIAQRLSNSVKTVVGIPDENVELTEVLKEEGIPHLRIPVVRARRKIGIWLIKYFLFFIPSIFLIKRILGKEHFDLVHTNGLLNIQVPLASKMAGTPVVWHLNDTLPYVPKFIRTLLGEIVKLCSHRVLFSSEEVRNYIFECKQKKYPDNFLVIGVPVVASEFKNIEQSKIEEVKMGYGYGLNGEVILGTVSNVTRNKNIRLQIEILRDLVYQGINAQLIVVGKILRSQQDYYKLLIKKIEDYRLQERVFFLGYQSDVNLFINSFDIFLFTSLSESGPMVIFEAILAEIPVVTTAVGIVNEVARNLGLKTVDLSTEAEMKEKFLVHINELLGQGKNCGDTKAHRDFIVSKYDIQAISRNMFSIYEAVLKAK